MAVHRCRAIKRMMNWALLTETKCVTPNRINSYDVGCFMVIPKDL